MHLAHTTRHPWRRRMAAMTTVAVAAIALPAVPQAQAAGQWTTTYAPTASIAGITITKLTMKLKHEVTGSLISAVKSCTGAATNYNFVVAISLADKHYGRLSGNKKAECEFIWNGHIVYKGFGINLPKEQYLRVNAKSVDTSWLKNI